jgi:hypothetical protein
VSLCPERAKRDAMTDPEFWDYVLLGIEPGTIAPEYEPDADELQAISDLTPCPECGEMGPCAYDLDGRPLVHLSVDDSEVSA